MNRDEVIEMFKGIMEFERLEREADPDNYGEYPPMYYAAESAIKLLQIESTRPPVAGLAELTPKQWGDLYEAIANTNLSDEAIFTAGREFLGKVDG